MELFSDLTFLAILNLYTVDWDTPFQSVQVSNYLSVAVLVIIVGVLLFFIVSYWRLPRDSRVAKFGGKFGPLLDGVDYEKERKDGNGFLIVVPVFFFTKRLIFVSILVLASEYLWVQVAALNFTALATVSFTLWYMPLESRQANLFDFFNDSTLLVLTYHLWCFTDIVGEAETRYLLGFWFIGASLGNIAVHLSFMIAYTISVMKQSCRKRKYRKNAENQRQ